MDKSKPKSFSVFCLVAVNRQESTSHKLEADIVAITLRTHKDATDLASHKKNTR